MAATIPEYERLRNKNIEENNRKLRELDLPPISSTKFKKPEDSRYVIHLHDLPFFPLLSLCIFPSASLPLRSVGYDSLKLYDSIAL
jgi:hypothetical protein